MRRLLHDTVIRSDDVAQRLFEGSMLVITVQDSMLHRFNETGTFIWQLLETPKSVGEIASSLKKSFDGIDSNTLHSELDAFISLLESKKLITITPSPKNHVPCTGQPSRNK